MHYNIVSLFPEWFDSPLNTSLIAKARKNGIIDFTFYNPRDYSRDKHKNVDDTVYGGGHGMLLKTEPLALCLEDILKAKKTRLIMLSPVGQALTQSLAVELSNEADLTLICGRYEGIDDRVREHFGIEPICVSDTIFNGGELAALAIIEASSRLLAGFMGQQESSIDESFSENLLEYPHYTRPENFENLTVPACLLNGNHKEINKWRKEASLAKTWQYRPELLERAKLSNEDFFYLKDLISEQEPNKYSRNLSIALVHSQVLLPQKKVGTTSLTNLDVHDIARSSCTYGLDSFYIVTPILEQKHLLESILKFWTKGAGSKSNLDRLEALSLVKQADSVSELIEQMSLEYGEKPLVYATSALLANKKEAKKYPDFVTFSELKEKLATNKVLILFGTGFGLAPEIINDCDGILRPLRFASAYNHLSVRAAVAIVIDRIIGDF